MFAIILLFEATTATGGKNLLLGFMPEPLGLLIFGAALVALPVGLRRIFDRKDERDEK